MNNDKRGISVAALGFFISIAGFVTLALLGVTNNSMSMFAAGWQMLGAAGIWVLIIVQMHQVHLVEQERADLAELERDRRERLGGAGSVFREEDAEQMEALAMGRRLRLIERWFVPIFAMAVSAFLAVAGVRMFPDFWPFATIRETGLHPVQQPSMMAFFAGAVSFITFALSRYALGMSRVGVGGRWITLRAGGAILFGTSIICLITAIALVLAHNGYEGVERRLGPLIGVLMIALAAEIVVNYVLDIYRPRVPGATANAFYESRLLGMFSEPGGIVRSVAQTIDYQFGFKVSETWFYQFLGRVVVPLLLFQAGAIYLVTCFVVVPQGYRGVVEIIGLGTPRRWVADPGVTFTWPWPWARATLVPVERIRRMELGYDRAAEKPDSKEFQGPVLWTSRHRVREYRLLVADRQASADAKVPVNLLSVTMPVQWRVNPRRVLDYQRQAMDVEPIVESLAYGALTQYAVHADLRELMGHGGIAAESELRRMLQEACDHAGLDGSDLGVEIVHVGLGGVHPPVEVAEAYENIINATEQKDTKIKQGYKDAAKTQIISGGEHYAELYDAIVAEEKARAAGSPDAAARTARVEQLFRTVARGEARQTAAAAEEYLHRRVTLEEAGAMLFKIQEKAYAIAPHFFRMHMYLQTLVDGLDGLRKYIIAVRHPENVLYQLDLKSPPPLELLQQEVKEFQESGGQ